MIDHFGVPAVDPAAAATFYTTVFAPLGMHEAMRFDTPGGPVIRSTSMSMVWYPSRRMSSGSSESGE